LDFGLSDEQRLLQETLRGFAAKECPAARRRELFEAGGGDETLWRGLCELGLAGLAVPEAHGGSGLGVLDLALCSEVLGEAALPSSFFSHALASLALAWGGSPEQCSRWLPRLATGDVRGCAALAEAGDRWQPESWRASLEGGRLGGEKTPVEGAIGAGLFVVGTAGGGLALVEADHAGIEPIDALDRTRSLAALRFDHAPAEALAGGAEAAPRVRDAALAMLAADAFGAAWQMLRMTLGYVGQREQFGAPLAQFQAVKHQLANAATELEPGRGLLWYAAHAVDALPERAPHAAAQAKAHLGDCAVRAARECVELHGGIGYTWESDLQIWFKRVLFDRGHLGNPEAQRERVAALRGW